MTHFEAITDLAYHLAQELPIPKPLGEWAEDNEAAQALLKYATAAKEDPEFDPDYFVEIYEEELLPHDKELFRAAVAHFWKNSKYECWYCRDERTLTSEWLRGDGVFVQDDYPCPVCTSDEPPDNTGNE